MSIQQEFIDSLRRWMNDELKDVLATNHLFVKGNKTEMVLRLQQFYREKFANDNTTPLDNSQHDGASSATAIPTTISLTPREHNGGTTNNPAGLYTQYPPTPIKTQPCAWDILSTHQLFHTL